MTRILPGVEIRVIKEIVPKQLNPSGVVGMIGACEKGEILKPLHVGSYKEFIEKFGESVEYAIVNDAKMAFQNGVSEVVVVRIGNAEYAKGIVKNKKGKDCVEFSAKNSGETGNNILVKVENGTKENSVRITITNGTITETFDNLDMDIESENFLIEHLNKNSNIVSVVDLKAKAKSPDSNPEICEIKLSGGSTALSLTKDDYEKALEKLESEPDVDIVMASGTTAQDIFAIIDAHCKKMSTDCKNRIGIGSISEGENIEDILKRTERLSSDRFILVAPDGVAGAVAGTISRLNYYESPTFKSITGIDDISIYYTPSELTQLLKGGVLALEVQRGRGIIIEKAISTSGEQISVTRVADHAVRGVKNIADNFIGTLNSPQGRTALKEKITEFFISMEKEGSIVPSTDGKKSAFLVDVYSSEQDFAQGVVRVDIAVRPVRAIDYIYATIVVQA